jgi:adhesin/invasin
VIEHGTASSGAGSGSSSTASTGGTPVQNGTLVTFTTTIGRIEPAEARTHNGQVTVTLFTGNESGTPSITAFSGGASTTNKDIKIGTAGVKTLTIAAAPSTLGSSGGTSTITASVVNESGGPVSGVPVTFSTDNGTLSPATATTDANGNATTTLSTTRTAKVTATSGTVSTANPLTVTVNAFPLAAFTMDTASPTVGTPVKFTVSPATGATISSVRIDCGNGTGTNLGPISKDTAVSCVYTSAGTYTAVATVTDNSGGTGTLTATAPVGALGVSITASGSGALGAITANTPTTFTAKFDNGAAPQVGHYTWTFSDGTPPVSTTSSTQVHTFTTPGPKVVRLDVFGVDGGLIATNSTTVNVQ